MALKMSKMEKYIRKHALEVGGRRLYHAIGPAAAPACCPQLPPKLGWSAIWKPCHR